VKLRAESHSAGGGEGLGNGGGGEEGTTLTRAG